LSISSLLLLQTSKVLGNVWCLFELNNHNYFMFQIRILRIAALLLLQTSKKKWRINFLNFSSEFLASLPCCFCKRLKFDVNHDDYIFLISDQNFKRCFPVAIANVESSWEPSMLCVRTLQWAGVVCRVHRSFRTRLLHRQILHESKLKWIFVLVMSILFDSDVQKNIVTSTDFA